MSAYAVPSSGQGTGRWGWDREGGTYKRGESLPARSLEWGVEVGRKELLVALVKHLGAQHPNLVVSVSGLSETPKPRISTFLLSCLSDMWADVLLCSAPEGVPQRLAGVLLPPGDSSFPGSDPPGVCLTQVPDSKFAEGWQHLALPALTPGCPVAARVQGL